MGLPPEYAGKKSQKKRISIKLYSIQFFAFFLLCLVFFNMKSIVQNLSRIRIDFGGERTIASSPVQKTSPKSADKNEKPFVIENEKEARIFEKIMKNHRQIKKREKDILKKEMLLNSIKEEAQQKIVQLKNLQKKIQTTLYHGDQEHAKKIVHLVKILESMKSKNAAAIFDQMPITESCQLAQQMNERKLSDIFAHMQVEKAKKLALSLLQYRHPFALESKQKE